MLHGAGGVAGFERLALVVLLFALTNSNPDFDITGASQHFQGYDCSPLVFCIDEVVYFAPFGQQLAAAGLFAFTDGDAVGAVDSSVDQP